MKTTKNIKSKVMKAAWTIYRKYKVQSMTNWSKALRKAWNWAKEKFSNPQGITNYNIVKETEKAICVAGQLACYVTDQVVKSNLWIPKSLITDGVIAQWFFDKKVDEAISMHSNYGGGRTLQFELV